MFFLKDARGPHSVGATRCAIPLEKPIIAGNANIPGQEEAGIRLEEVSFTMFYPTSVSSGSRKYRKGLRWLTGPLQTEIAGLAHFAGVSRWMIWLILAPFMYAYGQFIKIPVYQDAPLLYPSEEGVKWPLVIFSHGLGGSPTTYSQLCTRLAASGKIVIAMEHRDGTMPSCIAPYKGRHRPLLYIKESEVTWMEKPQDALPLRVDQLNIRQHEIYTTYTAFTKLVHQDTNLGPSIHFSTADIKNTWYDAPINVEDICLAGHSFGGCTIFSILSSKPPMISEAKLYPRIPVRDTLILDPWLEPLASPGPTPFSAVGVVDNSCAVVSDRLNENSESNGNVLNDMVDKTGHNFSRLLVINSEAFTLWTSHFERLAEVVKNWGPDARLITLLKSAHTSFSDYHVFPFIGNKASVRLIDIIAKLSLAFLNNPRNSWCSEEDLKSDESNVPVEILYTMPEKVVIGKWEDGSNRHKLVGEIGQVVLH